MKFYIVSQPTEILESVSAETLFPQISSELTLNQRNKRGIVDCCLKVSSLPEQREQEKAMVLVIT
jgi:hypothetical protein